MRENTERTAEWERLKVRGPLDTPAMRHNKALELNAARTLRSPLSGPSARYDAEAVLSGLGWPELAIRLAKGEDIGPAGTTPTGA